MECNACRWLRPTDDEATFYCAKLQGGDYNDDACELFEEKPKVWWFLDATYNITANKLTVIHPSSSGWYYDNEVRD